MLEIPERLKQTLIDDGILTAEKFDSFIKDSRRMVSRASSSYFKNIITDDCYKGILAKFLTSRSPA